MDAFSPPHTFARLGSASVAVGVARFDSLFLLLVCDFAHTGLSLSSRSPSCVSLAASLLGSAHAGISPSLRNVMRLELVFPSLGMARLEVFLLAVKHTHLTSIVPLRSFA
eukprot:TRINITY_DN18827_c0_g1_i1.p1 TRINITY_DN18827_c0_g1~~TRINITY_DN18827_c0_g1_i1.p1  ORF type:complete len:127 (+),score=10.78 TRINITY_DN18827_c0_g1_i1:52-381(+)